ncbi:MAG: HlyD family secretion protein [Gemmataceae bacterium]
MRWIRHRMFWFIGLIALTVSLLGANRIMHDRYPPEGQAPAAPSGGQRASRSVRDGGNFTGIVAPENEIVPLVPSAAGEVVEVFVRPEQRVKKGDKLLRLDDKLARLTLEESEAGVDDAELLLNKAQIAMKEYALTRLAQEKVIKAKDQARQAAEEELAEAKRLADASSQDLIKLKTGAAQKKIDALATEIEIEKIRLEIVDLKKPDLEVKRAQNGLRAAKVRRDKAQLGVDACLYTAPEDGTIMNVFVAPGSKFGPQIQKPAFLFYAGDLVVRAELNQEFVRRISVGQSATVEDDTDPSQRWTGKVTYVANQFLQKRDTAMIPDIMSQNQEKVLECRVTLDPGQPAPKLNAKVRVHIGGN